MTKAEIIKNISEKEPVSRSDIAKCCKTDIELEKMFRLLDFSGYDYSLKYCDTLRFGGVLVSPKEKKAGL